MSPHPPMAVVCVLGVLGLPGLLGSLGCRAVEGPLLSRLDSDPSQGVDGAVGTPVPPPIGPVQPGMRLQYQLTGAFDDSLDVELYVVDLFNTDAAQVQRLRDAGRVAVAYIAAGTYEPWRPDVGDLTAAAIGEPLASYPDESWLDVRDASVREMQRARIQLAADKGFDGVLLSSLDGYQHASGHDLRAQDLLDYDRALAAEAHRLGLAAGTSSDFAQADTLSTIMDFAIHLGCITETRCEALGPFVEAGRAVFNLEVEGTTASLCPHATGLGIPTTLKRPEFDAWAVPCP